jgi:hypothetical protein
VGNLSIFLQHTIFVVICWLRPRVFSLKRASSTGWQPRGAAIKQHKAECVTYQPDQCVYFNRGNHNGTCDQIIFSSCSAIVRLRVARSVCRHFCQQSCVLPYPRFGCKSHLYNHGIHAMTTPKLNTHTMASATCHEEHILLSFLCTKVNPSTQRDKGRQLQPDRQCQTPMSIRQVPFSGENELLPGKLSHERLPLACTGPIMEARPVQSGDAAGPSKVL